MNDPQKTIATLQRRMCGLRDRIDRLAYWMATHSDHQHADLSYETTQLDAMADLAREWCADFENVPDSSPTRQSGLQMPFGTPCNGLSDSTK